ncbi:delta-like protein 3 [Struthio camelus]|uniref:delta-like protein 3 n=1 Tax=Struthio camelus TaxID=8801 RepID=UPI0036040D33
MALPLLAGLLALLSAHPAQPAGVLELRVLGARGGAGGACGGPPSCRLAFHLCLRPPAPGGAPCSLGAARSPPGPPPAPGAPRTLRLPFAFPWPSTVSLLIETWRLEEAEGPTGRGQLLGRARWRQRLVPGPRWRRGAGGGRLRLGLRLHARPPPAAGPEVPWAAAGAELSPCALGPCFNGGACAPAPPPGAGYSCRCPPGFRGFNCERRADRCADRLCLHGGRCLDLGRSVTCKCRAGFWGARCEHNVDDCSPNPCANGGTCVDGANSYSCSCTLGYGGADCRRRADACAAAPCLHGATCYTHFSGQVCACAPGFMGPRCEHAVGGRPAAPRSRRPPPALAAALPLALLGPGLGLLLAVRRRCHPPAPSMTPQPPATAPDRRPPRGSATQV